MVGGFFNSGDRILRRAAAAGLGKAKAHEPSKVRRASAKGGFKKETIPHRASFERRSRSKRHPVPATGRRPVSSHENGAIP